MARSFKIGIFENEEKFLSSIRLLKEQNVPVYDVFTPYPVHEVFHLLGRKTRLPAASYFFGLFGMVATLTFLYYTSVISWPIVYGGKPFNSFPSFVVVTIVLTIFTVTILGLALFSARSKLFPGRDNTIFDIRATDNRFVIVVEDDHVSDTSIEKAEKIMHESGALEIIDRQFENVKI
jgi:hypothetical protein